MSQFIKEYKTDPFSLEFSPKTMKKGLYAISGPVSEENWKKACEQMKLPYAGGCRVQIQMEVKREGIVLRGHMECILRLECVRTLEDFDQKMSFDMNETMLFEAPEGEDSAVLVLEEDTFSLGDVLTQHIILEIPPYPSHPVLQTKVGDFDIKDGLEEMDEKNPFSVLKCLKS